MKSIKYSNTISAYIVKSQQYNGYNLIIISTFCLDFLYVALFRRTSFCQWNFTDDEILLN